MLSIEKEEDGRPGKEPMISVLDIEFPWSNGFYNRTVTGRSQAVRLTAVDFGKSPCHLQTLSACMGSPDWLRYALRSRQKRPRLRPIMPVVLMGLNLGL